MNPVFADTSFYIGLFRPGDTYHEPAVRGAHALRCPVVVTEFVLLEPANALARARSRKLLVDLLSHLRANANVTVVGMSAELFDRSYRLYAERPDKDWSLTDCISFVVMEQDGIGDALTADHHFEQAGFRTILLNS